MHTYHLSISKYSTRTSTELIMMALQYVHFGEHLYCNSICLHFDDLNKYNIILGNYLTVFSLKTWDHQVLTSPSFMHLVWAALYPSLSPTPSPMPPLHRPAASRTPSRLVSMLFHFYFTFSPSFLSNAPHCMSPSYSTVSLSPMFQCSVNFIIAPF